MDVWQEPFDRLIDTCARHVAADASIKSYDIDDMRRALRESKISGAFVQAFASTIIERVDMIRRSLPFHGIYTPHNTYPDPQGVEHTFGD